MTKFQKSNKEILFDYFPPKISADPLIFMAENLRFKIYLYLIFWLLVIAVFPAYAQQTKQPILVNGDTVEYLAQEKKISAVGNVVVVYQGSKLTCDKLEVSTQTKEGQASGNVVLEYEDKLIRGEKIAYNFDTKVGKIINANLDATPMYAHGDAIEKTQANKIMVDNGYMTSCDLDRPHWRLIAKQIEFYPEEKIVAKNLKVFVGGVPVFYFPRYVHYLKTDKTVHFSITPGNSKDWGSFVLTKTRFNLSKDVKARLFLDYRERRGIAEGFGINYDYGKYAVGDYKAYYMNEQLPEAKTGQTDELQRYLLRFRHKTQLENTDIISEFYRMSDINFLKDYFFREYTTDAQPKSYIYGSHNFLPINSNLSAYYLKRTNHFYNEIEKLPEVKFETNNQPLFGSPLYFKNITTVSNFVQKFKSPTDRDYDQVRCDTFNKISIPFRVSFLEFVPYGGSHETFFKNDINGSGIDPRTVVISGLDVSAKAFKVYNYRTNALGMDINNIRHVITPIAKFNYTHNPTIPSDQLREFDDIDTLEKNRSVGLELVNKLQTKTGAGESRDLAIFRIDTNYIFKDYYAGGSKLADVFYDLELMPYDWTHFEVKGRYDTTINAFKTVNIDLGLSRQNWNYLIGHRYARNIGKQMISQLRYRLNPLWEFRAYHRYEFSKKVFASDHSRLHGLIEQEYAVSRDLHCWVLNLAYNVKKNGGHAIWFALTCKAFPEAELRMDATYSGPRTEDNVLDPTSFDHD